MVLLKDFVFWDQRKHVIAVGSHDSLDLLEPVVVVQQLASVETADVEVELDKRAWQRGCYHSSQLFPFEVDEAVICCLCFIQVLLGEGVSPSGKEQKDI